MYFCSGVMPYVVFYSACDRSFGAPRAKQDTQSLHNKSSVEFQNEADDTDAKARALRGKWCHRGLLKLYLFKSNYKYGAPTHSITRNTTIDASVVWHLINGMLTRLSYTERESETWEHCLIFEYTWHRNDDIT